MGGQGEPRLFDVEKNPQDLRISNFTQSGDRNQEKKRNLGRKGAKPGKMTTKAAQGADGDF